MSFLSKHKKETQLVLATLVIILGVIFNWDFALVLFYILLDLITAFVLSVAKWQRMKQVRKISSTNKQNEHIFLFLNVIFLTTSLYALIALINPPVIFDFYMENLEEILNAGSTEFWIIPLVILAGYFQFKFEFIKGMEDRVTEITGFFMRRSVELFPFTVVPLGLVYFDVHSRDTILLILALTKLAFEYPVLRLEQKLMKQNLTKGY